MKTGLPVSDLCEEHTQTIMLRQVDSGKRLWKGFLRDVFARVRVTRPHLTFNSQKTQTYPLWFTPILRWWMRVKSWLYGTCPWRLLETAMLRELYGHYCTKGHQERSKGGINDGSHVKNLSVEMRMLSIIHLGVWCRCYRGNRVWIVARWVLPQSGSRLCGALHSVTVLVMP